MRGISEELLKATYQALLNDFRARPNDSGIKACLEGLMARCTELNPWLPIDENTPKDKELFLVCELGRVIGYIDSQSGIARANAIGVVNPTHYQELPDDPKE